MGGDILAARDVVQMGDPMLTDELADEFEKATAEGRAGIGTVAKRAALPSTTIRLDPEDIAKARVQAA